MLVFTAEQLRAVGRRIFVAAGAPEDVAAQVADSLVENNLAGHDSHGIIRIPAYVQAIQRGGIVPGARPTVVRETPTAALIEGNLAFGQVSATFATELAIARAMEAHLAAVGIVRCNHIGRLGEYAERGARAGLISMVVVGGFGGAGAAPFGGAARALGTNPFSFGVPTAPGFDEVLIPGEPEQRSRAKRLAQGIPVAEESWRRLVATAGELGLEPLV